MSTLAASKQAIARDTPFYRPSWIDRLAYIIDAAPGPAWGYYVVAGVGFILIDMLIKWRDGVLADGGYPLFHVVAMSSGAYYVGLIHYLDRFAGQTFDRFRPWLDMAEADADALRHRLTTLPARTTRVITGLGLVYGGVTIWGIARGMFLADVPVFTSPLAIAYTTPMCLLISVAFCSFFYHTVHQLRTISRILSACTGVSLFHQSPLYVFPRLTARTAVGWIVIGYAWIEGEPNAGADMLTVATSAAVIAICLAAFVWPFLGVHRILVEQKTRAVDDVTQRLRATLDEFHRRIDAARFDEVTPAVQATAALRQELELLEKIPTWPWRQETVRGVLTAVILPVLLWFVTKLLDRFFLV